MFLLRKYSIVLGYNRNLIFHLLKHPGNTAFRNHQAHHSIVPLTFYQESKFQTMNRYRPALSTLTVKPPLNDSNLDSKCTSTEKFEDSSHSTVDANADISEANSKKPEYIKPIDDNDKPDNALAPLCDDTLSITVCQTGIKAKIVAETESGESTDNGKSATEAAPLPDTVLINESKDTSRELGDNVTKINTAESLEVNESEPPTKNNNRCERKRKSKNPSLHATFKRPKLTSDDELSQTVHYFENGLRKVVPYDFKYNTFCKGRWVGKSLSELYTTEFRLYPIEYYERAVKDNRILVNLKPVKSLSRIVKNNDLISSISHRHECPLSAAPITIVADTDEFFVVNKPCSIPLHPAGRFRHNSLLSILARDFDKKDIFSIHRLDRMTSGLTVFTKSRKRANKCHTQIKERMVQKEYVCRVVGDFTKFSLPENHGHRIKIEGDEVTVSESLKVYDMKIGTSIVSREDAAKDCETSFRCLSTNGETSVVSCKPRTGRTHQIRVHLQYLGFPITNDPMYNSSAWGEDRFKLGPISKPMQEVMQELSEMKKWASILESFDNSIRAEAGGGSFTEVNASNEPEPKLSTALLEAAAKIDGIVPYRADCEECKNPLPDPKPDELIMYLHALRYKGTDWEFETPLPEWATPDWVDGD